LFYNEIHLPKHNQCQTIKEGVISTHSLPFQQKKAADEITTKTTF